MSTMRHPTHARRLAMGIAGFASLAATLLAMLYLTTAHGSARTLDAMPPAAAVEPADSATAASAAPTFHADARLDAIDAEPDPSPRSIAAYER